MVSLNRVIIAGSLVKEVESGKDSNGKSYAILTIAIRNEPSESHVTALEILAKGILAENCKKYLVKGSNIMAEGRISSNRMTIKGQSVDMVKVIASTITFVEYNKGGKK